MQHHLSPLCATERLSGSDERTGNGRVAVMLGAGRERKEDAIDPAAGIMLQKKPGNYVEQGDVLAFLHTNRPQMLPEAEELFFNALTWAKGKPQEQPLILDILRMEE